MTTRARTFPIQLDKAAVPRKTPRPATASEQAMLRPQRPVQEAALAARLQVAPSGLGLDSQGVRTRMVTRLRAGGLHCEPVLAAMAAVPRHLFVDTALAAQAYEDTSLPIGLSQTISKPSVVGLMISLLLAGRTAAARESLGKVLEIGTGCGYQAALLSVLGSQVYSIERLKPLHEKARELLAPLRRNNLRLIYGDGRLGHGPNAPYDSIIAAAGGEDIPAAWLDQLAVGGRLVAPMQAPGGRGQVLVIVDRTETQWHRSQHDAVHFVPLKSGTE
ncbi:protein-L-isoaspartate(D-aspartate) O-methyltransferase [Aquincola sp. MAHUQ-54]|uniref:Protein-L-isoaspartate O-methyltransferase n=1 Tax=Aquincola agrisoli TaxID=3119538 RepID=A0AAW9Q5K0_9BURK